MVSINELFELIPQKLKDKYQKQNDAFLPESNIET